MAAAFSGLSDIGQIAITVKDIERATAFYRDVLGMQHLFSAPPALSFFQAGNVRLMLTSGDEGEFEHPASILYFKVSDIEGVAAELGRRGVEFRTKPHAVHRAETYELWLADFYDCERNTFALMEEKKR